MLTLAKLQEATKERGKSWGDPGMQFRGLELSGESGELLEQFLLMTQRIVEVAVKASKTVEAMKKVVRFQNGMAGGSDDTTKLQQELGDTVISCALLANELNWDLGEIVSNKFNETSRKYGFDILLPVAGPDPEAVLRRVAKAANNHPCLRDDLADEHILDELEPFGYQPFKPRETEWVDGDLLVHAAACTGRRQILNGVHLKEVYK